MKIKEVLPKSKTSTKKSKIDDNHTAPMVARGWYLPDDRFLYGGYHGDVLKKYKIDWPTAYAKGWLHFEEDYATVTDTDYGLFTTSLPFKKVEATITMGAKRAQPNFSAIYLQCKEGLFEWTGKDFKRRKTSVLESINNIEVK